MFAEYVGVMDLHAGKRIGLNATLSLAQLLAVEVRMLGAEAPR